MINGDNKIVISTRFMMADKTLEYIAAILNHLQEEATRNTRVMSQEKNERMIRSKNKTPLLNLSQTS